MSHFLSALGCDSPSQSYHNCLAALAFVLGFGIGADGVGGLYGVGTNGRGRVGAVCCCLNSLFSSSNFLILLSRTLTLGVDESCLGLDVDGLTPLLIRDSLRSFFLSAVHPFSPLLFATSQTVHVLVFHFISIYTFT